MLPFGPHHSSGARLLRATDCIVIADRQGYQRLFVDIFGYI
jgi:hypothetical protein